MNSESILSQEKWLIVGLSLTVLIILSLTSALTWHLQWTTLAICTLNFFLFYPLVWVAWRCYNFWCQTIMQLTTYTQVLNEGEQNLSFKKQHEDNLLLSLQKEIQQLATAQNLRTHQQLALNHLLSNILDTWPIPVCLFNHKLELIYRNAAMNQQLQQPLLLHSPASSLGFSFIDEQFVHEQFNNKWQCQTIGFTADDEGSTKQWLFTAINVSPLLNQQHSDSQQSLIRVLSHELRNSLTPMYSMTDTLLSCEQLDEQQTRKVLSRIQQRSQRLLNFISEYSQLTQLPSPKMRWFKINDLIEEAKAMVDAARCQLVVKGSEQCFADQAQLTQVMINIFKNAEQIQQQITVNIHLYYQQNQQIIEVTDTGPGFANLDNVLTPFYTTKASGSGIGLSLCAEIIRNFGGQFIVENGRDGGAKITMTWPTN